MSDAPDNQLREVMETRTGRDVVWHLLGLAQLYHNPYSPDLPTVSFNCGLRESGIRLSGWLMAECPDKYLQMQKEQLFVTGTIDPGHGDPDSRTASADVASRRAAEQRAALIDDDGAGLGVRYPIPGLRDPLDDYDPTV